MKLDLIKGKRVKTIRGVCLDSRLKTHKPRYILFDDGETYIELMEQDPYSYHDCDMSAMRIAVRINKDMWLDIFYHPKTYPVANYDMY